VVPATWCSRPRNAEGFRTSTYWQSLHQVSVPVPYHEFVLLAVESAGVKRHKQLQESVVARMFSAWLGRALPRCSLKRLIFLSTQLDCRCVYMYVCIHIKQLHVSADMRSSPGCQLFTSQQFHFLPTHIRVLGDKLPDLCKNTYKSACFSKYLAFNISVEW